MMFFNVIMGFYMLDFGDFKLDGMNYMLMVVYQVVKVGIVCMFQNICLFGGMMVFENVMVGCYVCIKYGLLGVVFQMLVECQEECEIKECVIELFEYVGVLQYVDYMLCNLLYGYQCCLEIVCVFVIDLKLFVFDELVVGMNVIEKVEFMCLFDKICLDGCIIFLIEYDVKFVMGLCNWMMVFDYGKVIVEGLLQDVQKNLKVIEVYFGVGVY